MLHCKQCKLVKDDEHFYTSNRSKCKECIKKGVRDNRRKKIDYYRAYDRARANREDRIAARKQYAKTEAGKEASDRAKVKWTSRNTKKRLANNAVHNAIRNGTLAKPEACEQCGKGGRIEGHHEDYDKPLEVSWLCSKCHREWHKLYGEAKNAG